MRRIEVTLSVAVTMPEGLPPADYMRAIANYLADALPQHTPAPIEGADSFAKTWSPGRDVSLRVLGSITSERATTFEEAQFADLAEQRALL